MKKLTILFLVASAKVAYLAPVAKRMIDLTYVFDNDTLHHPIHKKFELDVIVNGSLGEINWVQLEDYTSATHAGTHMDAPCHFAKGMWTIEQIPMERFIAPAAVIDIEQKSAEDEDYLLTIDDLIQWETRTGQVLDQVVLLMRTGWGKKWGNRDLFYGTTEFDFTKLHYPGMSVEAAQWLVDNRNVYGVGTEALSLDNGPSMNFSAHEILFKANIYGLENVANVDQMPLYGAQLYVMPMKIGSASGAPTRIIATFPNIIM